MRLHNSLTGRVEPFEPLRPGDVRSSTADVSKLEAAFGWRPTRSLAEGLAETLAWYRARQVGARRAAP